MPRSKNLNATFCVIFKHCALARGNECSSSIRKLGPNGKTNSPMEAKKGENNHMKAYSRMWKLFTEKPEKNLWRRSFFGFCWCPMCRVNNTWPPMVSSSNVKKRTLNFNSPFTILSPKQYVISLKAFKPFWKPSILVLKWSFLLFTTLWYGETYMKSDVAESVAYHQISRYPPKVVVAFDRP